MFRALTDGEVEIEVLPAGSVVGVKEILDAVDKGLLEGGVAWDALLVGQASGDHALRFADGRRRAGHGQHRLGFVVHVRRRQGRLYDELWGRDGRQCQGFDVAGRSAPRPWVGSRSPSAAWMTSASTVIVRRPAFPARSYNEMGVAAVAMGGGDILAGIGKKGRLTPPSGAARSRTASSAFRRC